MMEVITVRNMRESDAHTIRKYVSGKELMYRAAMGVYLAAGWNGSVGILTGAGNNGGDGYALACILADHGVSCRVYQVSEKFSEDGKHYHDLAASKSVEIVPFKKDTDLSGHSILVDCLLGTGFSGVVRGAFRTAIKAINNTRAYVISVDINSGLDGDSGKAELAVKSNLTVCVGFLKTGLLQGDAIWYIDKLAVADIGIRLLREEYYLASSEEAIFPNSGLELSGDKVEILTPGEAEAQLKNGETLPELAVELALKEQRLIRILGKHPLVSDGYRTYYLEDGLFPELIHVQGEG